MDVLFLYNGEPHEVHASWAESVDADFMQVKHGKTGIVQALHPRLFKYDVLLCEDSGSTRIAALHKQIRPGTKIIRMIVGGTYYTIQNGHDSMKGEKWASKKVNGAIANSEWIKEQAQTFLDCPIKVVNPYIEEERKEKLMEKTGEEKEGILTVARHTRKNGWKGTDMLEEAAKKGDFQVKLIGNKTDLEYHQNIQNLGYVPEEKLIHELKTSKIYVQPSRADSFGIAVLEAIAAGSIPVVTENVGAKEVVGKVDENLIREFDPKDLAEGVKYAENLDDRETRKILEELQNQLGDFGRESSVSKFSREFHELVEGYYKKGSRANPIIE